ncbi:MAG: VWA domain-containing protein, partial [Gammaproteobacteria bacterium]
WLAAAEPEQVREAIEGARGLVPNGGTSLYNAFAAAAAMSPPPDNILLLTDGLPTQGKSPPLVFKSVNGKARKQHFRQALKQLPRNVPVNIILFPMEGDPEAAVEFWGLAKSTNGSFISPSRDWP